MLLRTIGISFGASIIKRPWPPLPPTYTTRMLSPILMYCPCFNDNFSMQSPIRVPAVIIRRTSMCVVSFLCATFCIFYIVKLLFIFNIIFHFTLQIVALCLLCTPDTRKHVHYAQHIFLKFLVKMTFSQHFVSLFVNFTSFF